MKLRNLSVRLILATTLAAATLSGGVPTAFGQTPEQASQAALQLLNDGQYKEAATAYEAFIKDYPTSLQVAEAHFRLGYLSYILGDYDKSIVHLNTVLKPPTTPEIKEMAMSLIPQSLAAKAGQEEDKAKKKAGYAEAIKQYDAYLAEYPKGGQVESVQYGKGLAYFQSEEYAKAAETLKLNLQQFPRSEVILDSQYLLALALATDGSLMLFKEPGSAKGAALCDEAEKYLQDIVNRRSDVALMNDAQFQLGEMLFTRGSLASGEERSKFWERAIRAYRAVAPKEEMIKAQDLRLKGVIQRKIAAGQARNLPEFRRLERLQEKETGKLEALKAKDDLTMPAKIKTSQIYLQEKKYDEARILIKWLQKYVQDAAQKKDLLYYLTLTYTSQNLRDQAVLAYNNYQAAHKGDPQGDNLPLLVGSLFLSVPPPDAEKALQYFKTGREQYPQGRFMAETVAQEATALVQLRRFDEALKSLQAFIATKPRVDLAAQAQFNLANIYRDTGKADEAIAAYKVVRDEYKDSQFAEQAAFWVGHTLRMKGDNNGAIAELEAFVKAHPESALLPMAQFTVGELEAGASRFDKAEKIFTDLAKDHPDANVAPYTYFQLASIYSKTERPEEMVKVMKEFITKFPESENLYSAYQTIAQYQISSGKPLEAIATYQSLVDQHPSNPSAPVALLQAIQLWRQYGDGQGRYLALNEEQRAEWKKGVENAQTSAEKLLTDYPESAQVPGALKDLLAVQRLLLGAKLKEPEAVNTYFEELAAKFAEKHPGTQSKILFTLASYIHESDKPKALALMKSTYKPELVYAPEDIDLYGTALLEANDLEGANAVFAKLAADFPIPAGTDPTKALPDVQQAQSIALYGRGAALQHSGKVAEAGALFDELKKLYPWSPKLLEANFGIAEAAVKEKKYDEATALLVQVIRANTATVELRAKASLLMGSIQEAKGDLVAAINQYIKIPFFFGSAAEQAAEGLWRGGQLLEKQAEGLPAQAAQPGEPTKGGQLSKALEAYQTLTERYPNSAHVKKAEERISALQGAGVTVPAKKQG